MPSKVVAKDKAGNESTITLNKITQINFPYKGQAQSLTLASGKYKLEVWGAQGGTYEGGLGGKGGYSGGTKELDFSAAVSVYVGGEGSSRMGGWNGGGAPWGRAGGGGGGGAVCGSGGGGSGYIGGATNGQTIAGNKSFPAPGGGKETGHSGNGYARITLVE